MFKLFNFKPEINQTYWYITPDGAIANNTYLKGQKISNVTGSKKNCFNTLQDARRALLLRK